MTWFARYGADLKSFQLYPIQGCLDQSARQFGQGCQLARPGGGVLRERGPSGREARPCIVDALGAGGPIPHVEDPAYDGALRRLQRSRVTANEGVELAAMRVIRLRIDVPYERPRRPLGPN